MSTNSPKSVPDHEADSPVETLWFAGVNTIELGELAGDPNYPDLLALLSSHAEVLRRRRVHTICRADQSRLNGEGVLHIAPEDFNQKRLLALLGVTDTGSDAPATSSATAVARHAVPIRETQTRVRSRLLAALRLLDSIIPPHTANSLAASLSSTAAHQLENETRLARSNRDRIAAWFAQKRLGAGATARPTDESRTKFNFFNSSGEYSGYSLRISSLPPFLMTYIRATKTGGRWETKILFENRPYENVSKALGR